MHLPARLTAVLERRDDTWFIVEPLQLADDSEGTIYLTGLSKEPPGAVLIIR